MKKAGDPRFEKELLQALRDPLRASERDAARTRVSRRLQATLSQLEVGAASALPLLLEAPRAAASQALSAAAQGKMLAAASSGVASGAAAAGGSAAGASAVAAAAHPLGVLLTAFALGAGAGGGTLVALSAGHVFESKTAAGPKAPVASTAPALRQGPRPVPPRASEPAFVSPRPEAHSAEALIQAQPTPRARVSVSPRVPAAPPPAVVGVGVSPTPKAVAGEPQTNTLSAQQALLDRARAALAHGDGQQALAALSEHARVHPTSELLEEREALIIKSLIASGDSATARARAAAFAARYPRSLFLPSIRAALPENP
jgi:hypothetical protein